MPRKATGSVYEKHGFWYASFTVATGKNPRHSARVAGAKTEQQAEIRKDAVAGAIARLRAAKIARDLIVAFVDDMCAASPARLAGILKIVDEACASHERKDDEEILTFGDVARKWTSGELHRDHPAHVKDIDHDQNKQRLDKHVLPFIGEIPIAVLTLEHAEKVMRQPTLPPLSRRHVAQLITRVCNLAVYPLRAIKVSPIPRGWLPKPNPKKAGAFLYPSEDAQLLACAKVDLDLRALVGFLDREGMRKSEAARLEWSDIDLQRGAVRLDKNKTDDPRAWKLDPGVAEFLRWWHERRKDAGPYVFGAKGGERPRNMRHLADELRDALKIAGVDRSDLFERSESRNRLRAHDTRATFITLSLAAGRSEAWVADRTGHRSSQMINNYKRGARMVSELELGTLKPLVEAIPETSRIVSESGSQNGTEDETTEKQGCDGRDSNSDAFGALEPKPSAYASSATVAYEPTKAYEVRTPFGARTVVLCESAQPLAGGVCSGASTPPLRSRASWRPMRSRPERFIFLGLRGLASHSCRFRIDQIARFAIT